MAILYFGIKASGTDGDSSAVVWPPEYVDALFYSTSHHALSLLSLSLFMSPDQDKSHIL